jgi:hypothetical protein
MVVRATSPLLGRIRIWQLFVGLGISGWCALYSVAVVSWGASSVLVGNTQGGCLAMAMTLAGVEARRQQRRSAGTPNPIAWAQAIAVDRLNQTITRLLQNSGSRVERCRPLEIELGFGVRAVSVGRTLVFETARWQEPVIDLPHVQDTEANRVKVAADLAIIVGAGNPDEEARLYVEARPLQLLTGDELKRLLDENRENKKI